MRAREVFPVPRGPAKRYAWRTFPAATAFSASGRPAPARLRRRTPADDICGRARSRNGLKRFKQKRLAGPETGGSGSGQGRPGRAPFPRRKARKCLRREAAQTPPERDARSRTLFRRESRAGASDARSGQAIRGTWEGLLSAASSGSDAVRRLPVRGTWPSTLTSQARVSDDASSRGGSAPLKRIAGSGNR